MSNLHKTRMTENATSSKEEIEEGQCCTARLAAGRLKAHIPRLVS